MTDSKGRRLNLLMLSGLLRIESKGLFPLPRFFCVRTRINEIEALYERQRVHFDVEQGSTFTCTRDLPYIASILFTLARRNYATVETHL